MGEREKTERRLVTRADEAAVRALVARALDNSANFKLHWQRDRLLKIEAYDWSRTKTEEMMGKVGLVPGAEGWEWAPGHWPSGEALATDIEEHFERRSEASHGQTKPLYRVTCHVPSCVASFDVTDNGEGWTVVPQHESAYSRKYNPSMGCVGGGCFYRKVEELTPLLVSFEALKSAVERPFAWLLDAVLGALPPDGTPRPFGCIMDALCATEHNLRDIGVTATLDAMVESGAIEPGPEAGTWRRWGVPEGWGWRSVGVDGRDQFLFPINGKELDYIACAYHWGVWQLFCSDGIKKGATEIETIDAAKRAVLRACWEAGVFAARPVPAAPHPLDAETFGTTLRQTIAEGRQSLDDGLEAMGGSGGGVVAPGAPTPIKSSPAHDLATLLRTMVADGSLANGAGGVERLARGLERWGAEMEGRTVERAVADVAAAMERGQGAEAIDARDGATEALFDLVKRLKKSGTWSFDEFHGLCEAFVSKLRHEIGPSTVAPVTAAIGERAVREDGLFLFAVWQAADALHDAFKDENASSTDWLIARDNLFSLLDSRRARPSVTHSSSVSLDALLDRIVAMERQSEVDQEALDSARRARADAEEGTRAVRRLLEAAERGRDAAQDEMSKWRNATRGAMLRAEQAEARCVEAEQRAALLEGREEGEGDGPAVGCAAALGQRDGRVGL